MVRDLRSQQLTQKITNGDLLSFGKCRVFPTKENIVVDPISGGVREVKYSEKYAACILARSIESMCGPSAKYYKESK
jgi:hypothetical protein